MLYTWHLVRVVGKGDGASSTPPVVQCVSIHNTEKEAHEYMEKLKPVVNDFLDDNILNKVPHYYRVINAPLNSNVNSLVWEATMQN